ncbi:MAG: SagB-type dehydrogenase [Methanobacterium sp. Maddingley MBC34]|nr:MAG: SagB-type dehydrogenase [Methanobacterium sp. Maddingley MBC34]
MDLNQYRYFLKDSLRKTIDFSKTDQSQGVTVPPIEKSYAPDSKKIELITADWDEIYGISLSKAIKNRESRRKYNQDPLTFMELSFLLWATQGVRLYAGNYAFRNVPSAGCRHALETYLAVFNVESSQQRNELEPGIYRYLPLTHELIFEFSKAHLQDEMIKATFGQTFAGQSAVTFIWSAIPYRMEWRYGLDSHKVIAMDAGHVGQNMYLACEAIGAGTCAIGAYDQEYLDELLRLDGEDEFSIYLAPVGKY